MRTASIHAAPFQECSTSAVIAPAKPEPFALAERRMQRGRRLVISGFVVSVAGIIGYCLGCFGASQKVAWSLMENPAWFVAPSLGIIGLGTLLWLVGSVLFLSGAMDSDPEGPDLDF